MQDELEAEYPHLDIQLLAVNRAGQEVGVPAATEDRDIPMLQDVDADGDSIGDAWKLWDVEWRDVVILDGNNERVGVLNLGSHDLTESENYNTLKNMLLDIEQKPPQLSSISGFVYFDTDNNGFRASFEQAIGNVEILVNGTDSEGNAVSQTTRTASDGSYSFDSLVAGTYTVSQTQPALTIDGRDTPGSSNGLVQNDRFIITLGSEIHAQGYNFGERGRAAETVSLVDFLASTPRDGAMVVYGLGESLEWFSLQGTWRDYSPADVAMTNSSTITVSARDYAGS